MSHTDDRISKYLEKDDIILCEINVLNHDGCDSDGPESNLYDLYLFFERNLKMYMQNFHDEDWFDINKHENQYFDVSCKKEISKREYKKILREHLKGYLKYKSKVKIYKNNTKI